MAQETKQIKWFNKQENKQTFLVSLSSIENGTIYHIWIDSLGKDRKILPSIPRIYISIDHNGCCINSIEELIPIAIEKENPYVLSQTQEEDIKQLGQVKDFIKKSMKFLYSIGIIN